MTFVGDAHAIVAFALDPHIREPGGQPKQFRVNFPPRRLKESLPKCAREAVRSVASRYAVTIFNQNLERPRECARARGETVKFDPRAGFVRQHLQFGERFPECPSGFLTEERVKLRFRATLELNFAFGAILSRTYA